MIIEVSLPDAAFRLIWTFLALGFGCGRLGYDAGGPSVAPDAQVATAYDAPVMATFDVPRSDVQTAGCGGLVGGIACEAFELGAPTGSAWTVEGPVTFALDKGFDGSGGIVIAVSRQKGGPDVAYVRWRTTSPITAGALHARARFHVTAGFAVDSWLILMSMGPGDTEKVSSDLVYEDRIQLAVGPAQVFPRTAPMGFPRDRWVCLELAVEIGSANATGSASLFMDGRPLLAVPPGTSTLLRGGYDQINFGVVHVSGLTGAGEVRVDDVVIARGPIGCD